MKLLTLLVLLILLPVVAAAQGRTTNRLQDAPFSQLTTSKPNGSIYNCINCQATVPCTSGGTGAQAMKINGVWACSDLTGGSGTGAPDAATYITQVPDNTLSNEQALSLLTTGLVKNTTTTGVLSIAVPGTDYLAPNGSGAALTNLNASALATGTIPDARFPATLPALNANALTSLNAANISGVIPIANLAIGTPTGTKFIRDDGTLQPITGGGDALVANPLSQFAATTSAQLRGVLSDESGLGLAVFNDSPVLVTPTIANFLNSGHNHTNAAGGGQLTDAAFSAVIGASKGGTGNAFFAVTGPATSIKTFTFPNASATVLTDAALVTAAQGGTANAFFQVSGPATTTKTFTFPNSSAAVLTDAAAITISQGGTGATTQTTAFNALDPLTTKGDVLSHDGTNSVRLAVGTNGLCIKANSATATGLEWGTCGSGTGDLVGPASATDNAVMRFDTTTGKLAQNSTVTIDDGGNISTGGAMTTGAGGTTAGTLVLGEGLAPSLTADSFSIYVPTDVAVGGLAYILPGAAASGVMRATNSAGVMTVTHDAGISHLAASTSADLAGVLSDEQGSAGGFVRATSPTFTTPVLGAATATSINGLTITSSTGTLTVANGKTATLSNTLTFTGTDTSSVAFGAGGTVTYTIASGTSALGTAAIASGACATVVTTAATGTATTDTIGWGFNGDPTAVTGYAPTANGMLTIIAYPSANNVNYLVCNNTAASVTPGAITLNWRVVR